VIVLPATTPDENGSRPLSASGPFERMIRLSPVPAALVDAADRCRCANDGFRATFGYGPAESPCVPDLFRRTLPSPDQQRRVMAAWTETAEADGDVRQSETLTVRSRGGAERFVILRWSPLGDGTRLVTCEEVQASAPALLELIDSLPDPTFVLDLAGTVVAWNRAIEELTGVDRREMLGCGGGACAVPFYGRPRPLLADLVLDEAAPGIEAYARVTRTARTLTAETFIPGWNDGAGVHLWGRASLLRDPGGRATGVIESIRDITEYRRTEQELRAYRDRLEALVRERTGALAESRERFRRLFDQAPVGMAVVSLDGRYRSVNPALSAITGYAEDELLALGPDALVHPDDARDADGPAGDGGEPRELRYLRRDGVPVWVRRTVRVVHDPSGDPLHLLAMTEDVTARKEAEERLRRSATELRRSNEDLQRFAYVASHDLQEPLRAMVSFSQLLDRRYRGRLDSDADEYIAFIVDGGRRMQRLIEDLLQISRIETRARPFAPTDAEAVLFAALRPFEPRIRETGARIDAGPLPAVTADWTQLEQVFANLVGNALKYRRPDVPPVVTISARSANGMVEFAVADNGIGIEEEYFDGIFEMFRRLHTHNQYEGTGIGLAVVKRIVERHGGTVRVESTPGVGSTFYFTLPAA
jgi:PAS domain S-box-containing protein